MYDLRKVNENKEKILMAIRTRGPSLPIHVAKEINSSPLFASAFLSELKAEDRIRISAMRVGSSPLYYLAGQENQLENFVKYLNQREREAFELLKKELIMDDEKQPPVVRVALRAIKDFAVPVKARVNGELKLFWKYFNLGDNEILGLIDKRREVRRDSKKGLVKEEKVKINELSVKSDVGQIGKERAMLKRDKEKEGRALEENKPVKKTVRKAQDSEFSRKIMEHLTAKDIEILSLTSQKKKEIEARIRIDTLFGKQEYYFVAKDKKSITENDFAVAWQKAQGEKLPALIMSRGELSRRGKEHLEQWRNLIKYEKLRL